MRISLQPGSRVVIELGPKQGPATVDARLHSETYRLRTDDGVLVIKHFSQIARFISPEEDRAMNTVHQLEN